MAVLTLTTLLTLNWSNEVPKSPKSAVSAAPGLPVAGSQLALTFQLFRPGGSMFQTNVAAEVRWVVSNESDNKTKLRMNRFVITWRGGWLVQVLSNQWVRVNYARTLAHQVSKVNSPTRQVVA